MIRYVYKDVDPVRYVEATTTELEVLDSTTGYRVELRHGRIRVWDANGEQIVSSAQEESK